MSCSWNEWQVLSSVQAVAYQVLHIPVHFLSIHLHLVSFLIILFNSAIWRVKLCGSCPGENWLFLEFVGKVGSCSCYIYQHSAGSFRTDIPDPDHTLEFIVSFIIYKHIALDKVSSGGLVLMYRWLQVLGSGVESVHVDLNKLLRGRVARLVK